MLDIIAIVLLSALMVFMVTQTVRGCMFATVWAMCGGAGDLLGLIAQAVTEMVGGIE